MAKSTKAKTTAPKKVVKKPVAKRTATKKSVSAKSSADTSFMQVKITDQTIYWLIFGAAAIVFALWLYSLDAKVRDLYDQIDANTYRDAPALNAPVDANSDAAQE